MSEQCMGTLEGELGLSRGFFPDLDGVYVGHKDATNNEWCFVQRVTGAHLTNIIMKLPIAFTLSSYFQF